MLTACRQTKNLVRIAHLIAEERKLIVLLSSSHQQLGKIASSSSGQVSARTDAGNTAFSAFLAIFWLDATALTYETINFDRFSQAESLILAVYRVLMTEGARC